MHKAILSGTLVLALGVFPLLNTAISQAASETSVAPKTDPPSLQLVPVAEGKTQASLLPFETAAAGNHSDDLDIQLAMMKDPKAVRNYFGGLLWRKRFVPFFVSIQNKGNYPIEVSMGNILLLEEKLPSRKASDKLSAPNPAKGAKHASKKKSRKDLPPFVPPTPPGYVFQKSRHIQSGWKSNLSMLALTGASLGFLAPLTVPSLVVGNMYRGANRKLVNHFQDLSLGRVTIEPGETMQSWLFYRRHRKSQVLRPKKLVFADIYVPKTGELSSFLIDYQPSDARQVGLRRGLDTSEVRDVQLFQGKITEAQEEQPAADKIKQSKAKKKILKKKTAKRVMMPPKNNSRISLAVSLGLLVCLGPITPLFAEPSVQDASSGVSSALYSQPHQLSVPKAIEIAKDSLIKTNFFSVLDYQEGDKIYVDGLYAKLSIKDHSRLLGNVDQSHLYRVRVDVKPQGSAVSFVVSAKNEDALGGGYAQIAKAKFEEDFNKRLGFLDKFQAEDPAVIAKRYLAGESLVPAYGFSTLKLMNLAYEPTDTFANYLNTLGFLDQTCPEKIECAALQESILQKDAFWSALGVEAKKTPVILDEMGKWIKPTHPRYAEYVSLLNDSAAFTGNSLDKLNDNQFESDNLPKEWKAKGVGTEKAKSVEKQLAFKMYESFKRSNALDVDTEEVLRIRRIGEKVFPYTLRKGLDYKIHIYDDTLGRQGTGAKMNAFTSGGGVLYISRSLIQRIDPQDEAAIAAVIAHELGHNEAYHVQRETMRNNVAQIIYELSKVGNAFVPGVTAATGLTEMLILKGFSRADELEADRLGVYVLYKAGYEPEAMGRVMKTLFQLSGERFTSLMDTHPAPPARLKRVEYLIKHRELIEKTNPGNAGDEFSDT